MRPSFAAWRPGRAQLAPASNHEDQGGTLPCAGLTCFVPRAPGLHVHQPWPDCKENSWPRLGLPSQVGPLEGGRGTPISSCRRQNSTPVAGMWSMPGFARDLLQDAGDRADRNAVDTSAGLTYNAHNHLPLGCSYQRSRPGSMYMHHAQPRLRFTTAPAVRSPACTLFLQRPQLLTRLYSPSARRA
jgi:hypothetical protein